MSVLASSFQVRLNANESKRYLITSDIDYYYVAEERFRTSEGRSVLMKPLAVFPKEQEGSVLQVWDVFSNLARQLILTHTKG